MTEQATGNTPTGIKVIAWTWIISALVVGADEVLGMMATSMLGQMDQLGMEVPPQLAGMVASATQFGAMDVAQIAAAVAGVVGGIALLRLKAWARVLIELLTWLTLVYTVARGILWSYAWKTMSGEIARDVGMDVDPHMLQTVGVATGIVLTLTFAVPLVLMIRYLRGAQARAATAPAPAAPARVK